MNLFFSFFSLVCVCVRAVQSYYNNFNAIMFCLCRVFVSLLFISFHSLNDDQFTAVISLSLEIVPWLSVIWLLWLYSPRCTHFFCLLPVFFMGISIAFCFYDFQLFSLSYFSSSGVKMLFNDIEKKIWLKSNCESCYAAHDYIGMYVLLRVLLDTFNLDDVPLKTGFQSIQTIGNKIQ